MISEQADARESLPALVLAGGINRIRLFENHRPGYKALLEFAGKPSLQYVLEALQQVAAIRETIVVGPEELGAITAKSRSCELVEGGNSLSESLSKGAEHLDRQDFLLLPADLPLVTPEAISDFLKLCWAQRTNAGLYWSMVAEKYFTGPFEQAQKGFNRFRDVAVCHGNLALISGDFSQRILPFLDQLYAARKSSLQVARICGWRVGFEYLFGVHFWPLLTLRRMARLLSRRFGVEMVPIPVQHPEIAIDVDEATDYRLVKQQLEQCRASPKSP